MANKSRLYFIEPVGSGPVGPAGPTGPTGPIITPGAAVVTIVKTHATGVVLFKTSPTAAAPAAGGYGVDARQGGQVRFGDLPKLTGVAGDTIVDTVPIANAAYTAGGIGFFNGAMGALICRNF